MTDVDIVAIREALANGTPGPWEVNVDEGGKDFVNARAEGAWDTVIQPGGVTYMGDADLIVLMRNNIGALLDRSRGYVEGYERSVEVTLQLSHERDLLTQALWDVRRVLGFDNDGDSTPAAQISGMGLEAFCARIVKDAEDFRRQWEEDL